MEPSAPVKPDAAAAGANAPVPTPANPPTHAPRPPAPISTPTHENHIWARRSFLAMAAWGLTAGTVGVWATAFLRFLFPRVLFEPRSTFLAGLPHDYSDGQVSEKYIPSHRVWIVREGSEIFAIIAICTHLGCTPRWLSTENKFKCPCHGSGYTKEGVNFEGPAPRPMDRAKITIDDQGRILVDTSVAFRWDKNEWTKPDAFINVT